MPKYVVEVRGKVRELYTVEAESSEEAADLWWKIDAEPFLTEVSGSEVYEVRSDKEEED